MAWDMGEIGGLSKPDRLPAPTTSSLARTVIVRPEPLSFCRLDIRDAERAQGLEPDYTWLPASAAPVAALTAVQLRAKRFTCVGNALLGKVWLTVLCMGYIEPSSAGGCPCELFEWEYSDGVQIQPYHSNEVRHGPDDCSCVQLLGEVCHRMVHSADLPSLVETADEWELDPSLQPDSPPEVPPAEAFPSAGYYRDGLYWGVACAGCYVQARTSNCSLVMHVWGPSRSAVVQEAQVH